MLHAAFLGKQPSIDSRCSSAASMWDAILPGGIACAPAPVQAVEIKPSLERVSSFSSTSSSYSNFSAQGFFSPPTSPESQRDAGGAFSDPIRCAPRMPRPPDRPRPPCACCLAT